MPNVQPPSVREALALKRIAITPFQGGRSADVSAFTHDVESLLTSVKIQGKTYFDVIPASQTASFANKKGFINLDSPQVVRRIASSLSVDGIMSGRILRADISDSPYQEKRSQCARSQTQYDKKGNPIGEICVRWTAFWVGCLKREAFFEFSPRLVATSTNQTILSNTLQGISTDQACVDSEKPISDAMSLIAQARNEVLEQIRVALAPTESLVATEIMEASWLNKSYTEDMKSPASEDKFSSGVEFAKGGRMDRACEIWKALEPIESNFVPLLYNIGVCEEGAGQLELARDHFMRADKLTTKPDMRVSAALARVGEQISSTDILTKARPDIFFRSSQIRSAEQDRKLYGYTVPTNGTAVKIRNASAAPESLRPGDTLKVSMDFSVMAPKGTKKVNVQISIMLKRDGKALKTLVDESNPRPVGGRVSEVDFKLPAGMPSGKYQIEQKVQVGTSYDVRPATFVVKS